MKLKWLEKKPAVPCGVVWGVPWKQGELDRSHINHIALFSGSGKIIHPQSWPTAFWPDGSVKWTGHAAVFDKADQQYHLNVTEKSTQPKANDDLRIDETDDEIFISAVSLECIIPKKGSSLIKQLKINGTVCMLDARLIAIKELYEEKDEIEKICKRLVYYGKLQKVQVEQAGSVRCVIKMEGVHQSKDGTFLPFLLRMYFLRGISSIKLVHTFFYDGDPKKDFVKGLGIECVAALKGSPWNRHVRIACENGILLEPGQLLWTRKYKDADGFYQRQMEGKPVYLHEETHSDLLDHVRDLAKWSDIKMMQDSAEHYSISKRTSQSCAYITAAHGKRAKGFMYVGGETGGFAAGLRSFWEKYPSSLQVEGLNDDETKMTIWLWPPEAEAMDLRHYDHDTHVISSYEGFHELRATPYGIANTNEIMIECFDHPPENDVLWTLADQWQSPPLFVCEPSYYYETKAAGIWSLPDLNHPAKAKMEERLSDAIEFFKSEIEQRSWYGFWHYGDVMHSYDPVRHQWRYDTGGFAWQNTELVPNLWLWYSFFRTGRSDVYKLAEAMTRHTAEVDRYHFGKYKGLGSRHNVIHWGCGCKEARISMAGLFKYFYYLTCDERTGDLLTDVRDVDHAVEKLDPMREYYQNHSFPTHVRLGPEWAAFCSNWLTEWERTENTIYRDKILKGIHFLKQLPFRLLSGPTFGYHAHTTDLVHFGDGNESGGGYHMVISFGAPQVWLELSAILQDENWDDMLNEFGEFYLLSDEQKRKRSNGILHDGLFHWPMFATGIAAFAARHKKDQELAEKVWNLLTKEADQPIKPMIVNGWRNLKEISWISTNVISQWCINTMLALEYIGEYLKTDTNTNRAE